MLRNIFLTITLYSIMLFTTQLKTLFVLTYTFIELSELISLNGSFNKISQLPDDLSKMT